MAGHGWGARGGWGTRVLLVVGTLVGLLWPVAAALVPADTSTPPDPVRLTDYRADFTVTADGRLSAVERLTAEFPSGRHGIYRFFDLADPSDPHARLVPEDVEVTLDGKPEPTDLSWQQGRRFRVARIGDPDVLVTPGEHLYTIRYTIQGAIGAASDGSGLVNAGSWAGDAAGSAFSWNLVPGGWQMDIARTRTTVRLPETPDDVACRAGTTRSYACTYLNDGRDLSSRTGALPPRTPVTVRAALASPPPDRVSVPWSITLDGVLGRSPLVLSVLVVLALVGLLLGARWSARAREDEPGFPVMYEPPPGLGPVQAAYVATESIPANALVATLLHQAERGLTRLTQVSTREWRIEGLADAEGWDRADPVSREVADTLGVTTSGVVFEADGSVKAGRILNEVGVGLPGATRTWAQEAGLVLPRSSERLGRLAVIAAAVLAGVCFALDPFTLTASGLPLAGFAIGGAGLLGPGVGTRRTAVGRELWSRAGGFHRLLSTTSAQDRFDFSAHRELYTAFIPYAVAFDCAEAWARKYEVSTGTPAPLPVWYGGGVVGHGFVRRHLLPGVLRVLPQRVHRRVRRHPGVLLLGRRRWRGRRRRRRGRRRVLVTLSPGATGQPRCVGGPHRRTVRGVSAPPGPAVSDTGTSRAGRTPMIWVLIVVVLLVLLGGLFVVGFNRLRRQDVAVEEALGGVDVQLTRRADLIPNLVNSVKGYASHERGVFEEITVARAGVVQAAANGTVEQKATAEARMDKAILNVMAVAEAYPDLKASANFLQLQSQLADTEGQLAFARQYYNDAVGTLNTSASTLPWMFFAGAAGVSQREFYEAPAGSTAPPTVQF